jgi:hypothetical protein
MCRYCVSDGEGSAHVFHDPRFDGGFTAFIELLDHLDNVPTQLELFPKPLIWPRVVSDVEDL